MRAWELDASRLPLAFARRAIALAVLHLAVSDVIIKEKPGYDRIIAELWANIANTETVSCNF